MKFILGILYDFEKEHVALPEPKRMKGQYLLADPALQPGVRNIQIRLVRELAGNVTHLASAQPGILLEPPIYDVLRQNDYDSPYADRQGDEATARRAWEEWDEALEFFWTFLEKLNWVAVILQLCFPSMLHATGKACTPGGGKPGQVDRWRRNFRSNRRHRLDGESLPYFVRGAVNGPLEGSRRPSRMRAGYAHRHHGVPDIHRLRGASLWRLGHELVFYVSDSDLVQIWVKNR